MTMHAWDQAIILHCRPYRETSLLIDALTREHGRLRLLGKGVRGGRHPRSALLRPFNPVGLTWTGRGDLPLLTGVEPMESGVELSGAALFCGFYLCELLMALQPPADPHPDLYLLCQRTLRSLATAEDLERTLRRFEISLLEEIGYGLRLDTDAGGHPIRPAARYLYHPEHGAVETSGSTATGYHGGTLLALRDDRLEKDRELREAKRLLRTVLAFHLQGRPLKSRELFKPLSKQIRHAR